MRALHALAFAAATLAASPVAQASEGTMWGGELPTATALHVEGGFPWVGAGYRIPVTETFEIMPTFRFSYVRYFAVNPSLALGAEARLHLLEVGRFHGSLTLAMPLQLFFGAGGTGFAIGLFYPGWAMDYSLDDEMKLVFGARFEDDLYFVGGGSAFIATLPLFFGFETQVGAMTMGAKVEGGPAFVSLGGFTATTGDLRVLFGVDIPL